MVEEERTQIGTLKALGYGTVSIASKYLKYAFLATVGGSLLGILVGEKILPWVIVTAYGIMYQHTPRILLPYNWTYGLLAAGAALICTIGATLSACFKAVHDVPANLMRPPAPKQGRRVLLEYFPFLWKHLSFSWKSSIRNLMRYKKRCLMTVIGIGGCMGLLLVGYGLRDSIMDVAVLQFDELQHYEAMVLLDDDASEADRQEAITQMEDDPRFSDAMVTYLQKVDVQPGQEMKNQKEWSARIVVPETLEGIDRFFTYRSRTSKEVYTLGDEGAIVTEKLADELNLKAGDRIIVKDEDNGTVEIPIAEVCENYLYHYIYLSPTLYQELFDKAPDYNCVMVITKDGDETELQQAGSDILECDGALSVTYTYTLAEQVDNMLGALDLVIIVLIVSAGMLAFVVLYNLNNININERKRELATIKVLGFYDGEVAAYVYRENVLLTIVGAFAGVFIGKLLHGFIIGTVEVDSCMFGRSIKMGSFVYGILFTVAFSVLVNGVMYFKLKKIDMVESLKSIE
jgi:putative ABC transport system permease protein